MSRTVRTVPAFPREGRTPRRPIGRTVAIRAALREQGVLL